MSFHDLVILFSFNAVYLCVYRLFIHLEVVAHEGIQLWVMILDCGELYVIYGIVNLVGRGWDEGLVNVNGWTKYLQTKSQFGYLSTSKNM